MLPEVATAATVLSVAYFTGLSSSETITVTQAMPLVLAGGAVYVLVHVLQSRGDHRVETKPRTFTPRAFTTEELAWYDGERNSSAERKRRAKEAKKQGQPPPDPNEHPLQEYDDLVFIGCKGTVYVVGHDFYGPGSAYNAFAGRDSSRHLGKIKVGREEANADWKVNLSRRCLQHLDEWDAKFKDKYPVAGWIVFDDGFTERAAAFAEE